MRLHCATGGVAALRVTSSSVRASLQFSNSPSSILLTPFPFRIQQKRMDTAPPGPNLQWSNVGFGFAFIAMNMALSQVLQLQIGTSLVISALRCTVQLTFVATILKHVFAAQNIWIVAAIARSSYTSIFLTVAHYYRPANGDASAAELAWHVRNWCVFISSPECQIDVICSRDQSSEKVSAHGSSHFRQTCSCFHSV
jgi:hypothetical protein